MFRTFTEEDDRRQQQRAATKAGVYSGGNNNGEKIRIVRDRTTDTQTTVSSLSGVYSTDLLTEYSGDYTTSDNDYIVSIAKDVLLESKEEIEDEMDLDARSESTTMTSNKLHEIQYPPTLSNQTLQKEVPAPSAYTNPNSIYDIPRSSSWAEDKPFDEESILNMSEISESDKARMLPSYYANGTIPVKEYILPPPPPLSASSVGSPPPSPPPMHSISKAAPRAQEIIEISPDTETGKSVAQVGWNPEDNSMAEEDMYLEAVSAAAGAGATLSTASFSKARSFQSKGQKKQTRRLKLCVIAGFLVTLLCLIVIIIAVAVSKNKTSDTTDLSSSAVQSGSGGGLENTANTASPSLRATAAPTAVATVVETAAPTQAPNKPAPWYDENAPANATPNPTAAPTAKPVAPPTESPTNRATPKPTENPTVRPVEPPTLPPPTEAPTVRPTECVDIISTTQDCLDNENVLVTAFQNCEPEDGDWVGLYPDGSVFIEDDGSEFLTTDWISWAWTCGDTDCQNSPPSNTFSFEIDMEDPAYELFNLRAYLVRASRSGPPFEVIAKSEPFAVTEMCGR